MVILVVGTGALACLFAARLAASGNEVAMLGSWPEGLAALRKQGVGLHDLDGSVHHYPVDVLEEPCSLGSFDQALVLVKSWQTQRVAAHLGKCLSDKGVALTLQNGLGNDEILKNTLGGDRVALGVTTVGARMLEPGQVQFTGNGKIFLGDHPRLEQMVERLDNAGFQVEVVANPASLLWGKLMINAAINPLTGLLRIPNGELLERSAAREIMVQAALEVSQVAASLGITLPYTDPVAAVEQVARSTSANFSSMLQDVLRGATTEIEAINGAVVREAKRLGMQAPVNHVLWMLVKSLDQA